MTRSSPPRPLAALDAPDLDERQLFLDGQRRAGEGEALVSRYPATGEELLRFRGASEAQVASAVAAARRAFSEGDWRRRTRGERADVLDAVGRRLTARAEELARTVVLDNGKTLPEATIDVRAAAGACFAAAAVCRDDEERAPATERGVEKRVWREPVGVIAALAPFNAPLMFAALKAAPALAAGNSVVLKPSERAPLLPVELCAAAAAEGVPPGVLGLLQGGVEVAAALCEADGVDMISLTGGVAAGSAVMRAAAPRIKNVLLELGGKSAHIVLADADLERAVPAVAAGIYRNAGQRCFSGSRLLVEESVADEVLSGVVAIARDLRLGDPFDPATDVGSMIDSAAVAAAQAFVDEAVEEGLEVLVGGAGVEELLPGSFYRPTVLGGARPDARACREEIFGPILTVVRVADAREAVEAANATPFGLAGGLWTGDARRALELAREVRCGYFWINTYGAVFGDVPFGGYGRSGLGREGGRHAYDAYSELKSVLLDTTGGDSAPIFDRTDGRNP